MADERESRFPRVSGDEPGRFGGHRSGLSVFPA